VAVGSYDGTFQGALFSNTTGSNNIAVGSGALASNTTANNNTAVGYIALNENTTGVNTAVGRQALYSNTTGTSNTAVGGNDGSTAGALQGNTTGSNNVAMGVGALSGNTTGTNTTALGYQAGYSATTGNDQVMVGYQAGKGITSASNNICIGSNAGNYTTPIITGAQNIHIGAYTTASSSSASYEIVIGYISGGKGASTGFINPNSGGVYQGNNSAAWSVSSDQRLKKNIVDNNVGLDKVVQIQVRNFEYRTEDEVTELPKHSVIKKEGVQLGVIAQELQAILPDCVKTESTGVMSVDSTDIMYHMINAIKELSAEVNALKAKVGA